MSNQIHATHQTPSCVIITSSVDWPEDWASYLFLSNKRVTPPGKSQLGYSQPLPYKECTIPSKSQGAKGGKKWSQVFPVAHPTSTKMREHHQSSIINQSSIMIFSFISSMWSDTFRGNHQSSSHHPFQLAALVSFCAAAVTKSRKERLSATWKNHGEVCPKQEHPTQRRTYIILTIY